MKIRSLYEFEKALDQQFGWRKQEIVTIGVELKSARGHQLKLLFRSGIVLLYAHWEGIIRFSAECFLDYLNRQGQAYKDLKPCFLFYAVKEAVDTSSRVNLQNFSVFEKTMGLFLVPLDTKFDINPKFYISTKENQNITSEEFKSIIKKLGLEYLPQYELREKLVDDQLLYYRNTIAHGESTHENIDDFFETFRVISEKILDSLNLLRNQMIEALKDKKYLLAS
jgi:hypothetical protein